MTNKNLHFTIRFINAFNKFYELKKQIDTNKPAEVETDTLFEEFEEKFINNMKLLCFKTFLKDAQKYAEWSKGLDELRKENALISTQQELLSGNWSLSTQKMTSLVHELNSGSAIKSSNFSNKFNKARKSSINLGKSSLQLLPPSGKPKSGRITTGLRYHNPQSQVNKSSALKRCNSISGSIRALNNSNYQNQQNITGGTIKTQRQIISASKVTRNSNFNSNSKLSKENSNVPIIQRIDGDVRKSLFTSSYLSPAKKALYSSSTSINSSGIIVNSNRRSSLSIKTGNDLFSRAGETTEYILKKRPPLGNFLSPSSNILKAQLSPENSVLSTQKLHSNSKGKKLMLKNSGLNIQANHVDRVEQSVMAKQNKWSKIKQEAVIKHAPKIIVKSQYSSDNSNRTSPETKNNYLSSPVGSQDEKDDIPQVESDDDFMRQISITDCDSPKRSSVKTNYKEFQMFTSDLEQVDLSDFKTRNLGEEFEQFDPSKISKLKKKQIPSNVFCPNMPQEFKNRNNQVGNTKIGAVKQVIATAVKVESAKLKVQTLADKLMLRHGGKH